MRIRAPKDFWSGVMFCGFAAVAISAAHGYSLGSAGKMGPGYFPLLLAVLLALLGAALIVRSVVFSGEPVPRFHIWPLTVMSAWAGARLRWAETLALAAALIIFSAGVFVYALGLPLNIWPGL